MVPAAVLAILVKADTRQAKGELARMNAQLESTGKTGSKAASRIAAVGKVGALGAAGGLVYAVKKAADFEQQMDRLGSVSEANRKEMKRFEKQAMDAGLATKFSALEAAAAQTELAKGGLTIKQIMGGGLKSALALAAAGEMELADAATATVNAMKLFGLRGTESMKVADGFAKAANATTADVKDFTMALSQGGGAARAAGYDFRETVVVLEALAEIGVKNSDAGTSLKTTFAQLASPTKVQKEAMKGLNLEFFNAEGNMKRASVISQMLRDRTEGLTREQRLNAFSTLAGTDGMRTLLALYEAGPKKLERYRKGLEEQGTAARVAAEKQDNLKGALENLQGSVETIGISIGTKLLPPLTKFVKRVTRILSAEDLTASEKFEKIIDLIVDQIEAALPKLVEAVGKIAPKVASAFWGAFKDLPVGGQILTAAVIGKVLFGGGGSGKAMKTVGGTSAGSFAAGFTAQMKGAAGASVMNIISEKLAAAGGLKGKVGKFLSARGQTMANPLFVWQVNEVPGGGGGGKTISGTAKDVATGVGAGAGAAKGKALFGAAKKVGGFLVKRGIPGIGAIYTTIEVADALGLMDKEARQSPREISQTTGARPKPGRGPQAPGAGLKPRDDIDKRGGYTGLGPAQGRRGTPGKDESAAASAAGMEQLNKRLKVVRESIRKLRDTSVTDIKQLQTAASRNFKTIGDDIGLHTRKGRRAAADNFEAAATAIGRSVAKGRTSSKTAMAAIESLMRTHSKIGKERLSKNLADAADNVRQSMKEGKTTTKEGMRLIEHYMVKSLMTMGFTKKQALMVRKGQDPYTGKAIGGDQNLTNKQRGGHINRGALSGDSVPAMLERDEYVLNRKAVKKVGRPALDALNFGAAPRFQLGGMVRIPGDPDTTAGRDKVAASIASQVGSFIKRFGIQVNYAYDPGGSHQSPGHNVTGTALDVGPYTSGWEGVNKAVGAATAAGKTVYYDGRFGSINLPPHGEGHHAHIEWGPSGGVGGGAPSLELGRTLKRLQVEGPDSLLKANVQGALDVARGGANAVIGRANEMVSAVEGSFAGVDMAGLGAGATANRELGKRMAAAMGWEGEQWTALDRLWGVLEGSWDENLPNLAGSGAYGIAQALPSSKYPAAGQPGAPPGIQKARAQIGWGLRYIKDRYGDPVSAVAFRLANNYYAKGGPVGYAGDSLGVGTAPLLKGILDRVVYSNSRVGRSSAAGVPILKDFERASQLVFDLGTNDPNAAATHSSLLAASRAAGKRPLHFLSLLGGPDQAAKNKMFRSAASDGGHEYLTDYAARYKGGHDSIGHPSSYGSRAQMLAASIKKAAKATEHPNKPGDRGKVKKRKHLHGLQAPSIDALNNAVEKMRYSPTESGQINARNHIHDLIRGVGLPRRVGDRIDGLTDTIAILDDFATAAGQLTIEDEAGNVTPGLIAGKSEVNFLEEELTKLMELRNRLLDQQEKLAARREQIRKLLETAQKHLDYYKQAVTTWGHVIRVQEAKLKELRKHPKKNKKEIESTRDLIMALKPEQKKTVFTRDSLRGKIIPALKGKLSGLRESHATSMESLEGIQGLGAPMDKMATTPDLGVLRGTIFATQLRLRELKAPPPTATAEGVTSDRDDLLKEIGRLTVLRTAVEDIHAITLRDFPDYDRLGIPFGGAFAEGGVVPGPIGAPRVIVAHGGETVTPPDVTPNVTINIAPGMEWLKQFISVEVNRTNRTTARGAARGLPGQGGGRLI